MTIAIVTISFPTVSETFIANKVLHLAKKGHNLVVFCSSINTVLFNKLFSGVGSVKVVALTKRLILSYAALHPSTLLKGRAGFNTLVNKARLHYINKYKPDVVHIEFSGLGVLYLPVLKKVTAKKVVSCRGSAEKVKLLASDERKKDITALFNEVDAIHCVSSDMQQTVAPYCSDASKFFVNFPSVDVNIFKRTVAYELLAPANILSIGRFTFQKGYFTGLQAMAKLKEQGKDFTWTIIGDGPLREELFFHIHQMGLQQHVQMVGQKTREEIIAAYNSASIFFLPSVYEGIANVVLEAMSMELPVVATRSGGMQEVITHNFNGMLADVYDADTLAGNLTYLISNAPACRQMGLQARQRIKEQFTIEHQANVFDTVYTNLVKN